MEGTNTQNYLERFLQGFGDTISEDSEHFREVNERVIEDIRGEDYRSARRWGKMMAENPTVATLQDLFEKGDPDLRQERINRGMGLSQDQATKLGQVTGRLGQDIVRDSSRGIWWLINAPQAVADIIAEEAIHRTNPDLRKEEYVRDEDGNKVYYDKESNEAAYRAGATNIDGYNTKHVNLGSPEPFTDDRGRTKYRRPFVKANTASGVVNALKAPTSLAINAGMGLLHYTGGMEGYTAAIPSEEDPTKTANVIAEIGAKYIVGRTGNLLPWEQFKEVRPDVSKEEYQAYKAFKYDKSMDLNPLDGDVNLLPMGLLKATADGIHGAEVQFLGRSLPVNETLLPVGAAIAGSALGAYGGEEARDAYKERGEKKLGLIKPIMADDDVQPRSEKARKQISNRTA